jgi:putative membrane protein
VFWLTEALIEAVGCPPLSVLLAQLLSTIVLATPTAIAAATVRERRDNKDTTDLQDRRWRHLIHAGQARTDAEGPLPIWCRYVTSPTPARRPRRKEQGACACRMAFMPGPRWQREGHDPDYRFSLANERTFLAWIRTAMALLAAAVAVVQLVPSFRIPGGRTVLGVLLAVAGIAVALSAYLRWRTMERAMRTSAPVRYSIALPLLTAGMGLLGLLVLLLVVVGRS